MSTLKMVRYNISESFNMVRWALTLIMFAFVAVVSVAKYIQLSDMTSITYSSLETTYLILNDTTNIIYIYLPLYLFLICGIMFDDNFGSLEVIKAGSRRNWLGSKGITLLFYTVLYFMVLFGMNFLISDQVFPFSSQWSSDFVHVQVLQGQNARNFMYTPIETIGLSLLSVLSLYLVAGCISVLFSLITNKEAYALFVSLVLGIGISALFVYGLELTSQISIESFAWQNAFLLIGIIVISWLSFWVVSRRDFKIERKE